VRHLLNSGIDLAADDGSLPWHRGVKGYLHPCLIDVQAMGLKGTTTVEGNWPVVAEAKERVPKHLRKPWAVLARGTKTPILTKGTVGVVVHVHL
jgi:hypothetical protein